MCRMEPDMTKDEKQRRITKAQMERFERSLDALQHGEES